MGFAFFTNNIMLNVKSLGLSVGAPVDVICIGGGGGGGGGSSASYNGDFANGNNGGNGGVTSFGSLVSANGGGGGEGGYYRRNKKPLGGSTEQSTMLNANGGNSTNSGSYGDGGAGGGFGEYVYKKVVLNEELIPVVIGDRGKGGEGASYYKSGSYANTIRTKAGNGGDAGCCGELGLTTSNIPCNNSPAGGGGSGYGAGGGGGGAGVANYGYAYDAGAGGGAGGYFIGEKWLFDKKGKDGKANGSTGIAGNGGTSADFKDLFPGGIGQHFNNTWKLATNGVSYPTLNDAGRGLVILMW